MNKLFFQLEKFIYLIRFIIFLFPFFSFVYFIRERTVKRFLLFIGVTFIIIGKFIHWMISSKIKLAYKNNPAELGKFFNMFNYDLMFITLGYIFVVISFYLILRDKGIFPIMDIDLWNKVFISGVVLILLGYIIFGIKFVTVSHSYKSIRFIKNIFHFKITFYQLIIIMGVILNTIGIIGTLITRQTRSEK